MKAPIYAAFDKGQVPNIAICNLATVPLGVDFGELTLALQSFVDTCVVPVWGTPCHLLPAKILIPNTWAIVFLDNADAASALGYHDLTPDGFPLSKVFVKTALQFNEKVSVTASHELVEMLVDPAINLCAQAPNGIMYAYETADACEALSFPINGIPMSDFVYPSWFEGWRTTKSTQFDYLDKITTPFQLLSGGYANVFSRGKWRQIFGSQQKKLLFAKEDRRGHRSQYRKKVKV